MLDGCPGVNVPKVPAVLGDCHSVGHSAERPGPVGYGGTPERGPRQAIRSRPSHRQLAAYHRWFRALTMLGSLPLPVPLVHRTDLACTITSPAVTTPALAILTFVHLTKALLTFEIHLITPLGLLTPQRSRLCGPVPRLPVDFAAPRPRVAPSRRAAVTDH